MAVITCPQCERRYDDAVRWTICPHSILEAAPRAPRGTGVGYCAEHDLYSCPHHADSVKTR